MSNNGKITIPDQALKEYNLVDDARVILMSGSKRSGGFGVTSTELLKDTVLWTVLDKCPQLKTFEIAEGQATRVGSHVYCWVKKIRESIMVPIDTLKKFEVNPQDNLLVIRGSGLAVGFIVKGPIIDEAKKHSDIPIYE
ncbi:MAG: hypothetical protein NWF01_09050 [Candidatus Bathyarchaeota archaeon]|nr:hypothetical protein [Candidatus Bathyarchaeota archaeon]